MLSARGDDALRGAVGDARRLLDDAGSRGLVIDPSIITAIGSIEGELNAGTAPDASSIAAFKNAYDSLKKRTASSSASGLQDSADTPPALNRRGLETQRRPSIAKLCRQLFSKRGPSLPSTSGNDALKKAVGDARRLLDYAVSRGLVSDPSIITAIVSIEGELNASATPSASSIEGFLKAYDSLSKQTGGVSAESLSPEAEEDERKTRVFYISVLSVVLIILV